MLTTTLMRHRAVRRVVVPGAVVALAAVAAASVVRGHPASDDVSDLAAKVTEMAESRIQEALTLSDRIAVMSQGQVLHNLEA